MPLNECYFFKSEIEDDGGSEYSESLNRSRWNRRPRFKRQVARDSSIPRHNAGYQLHLFGPGEMARIMNTQIELESLGLYHNGSAPKKGKLDLSHSKPGNTGFYIKTARAWTIGITIYHEQIKDMCGLVVARGFGRCGVS